MKRIEWMTELPERCDHPESYLQMEFDILDMPIWTCQKCGHVIGRDEKKYREQQKLEC